MKSVIKSLMFVMLLIGSSTATFSSTKINIAENKSYYTVYLYGYIAHGGNEYAIYVDSATNTISSVVELSGPAVTSFSGTVFIKNGLLQTKITVYLANSTNFGFNGPVYF